jgi:hypothetical protein
VGKVINFFAGVALVAMVAAAVYSVAQGVIDLLPGDKSS